MDSTHKTVNNIEVSKELVDSSASSSDHDVDVDDANKEEHELTLFQAIKLYRKAIVWSMIVSAANIMDGYDVHVVGGLYAQPAFRKAYGHHLAKGGYEISAAWQAGLNNGSAVGSLLGLYLAGYLTDKFGFRMTISASLILIMCLIFLQFFANGLVMLEIAQLTLGVPLAVFQTITSVYAVEVTPTRLRPYLTSYVSLMWTIGSIVCTCVIRSSLHMKAPWAYRLPFAIQWLWPVPILVAVLLGPESPWWLVRHNRIEDAKKALRRLTTGPQATESHIQKTVALMKATTEHERILNSSTSYAACFKGIDLRRTTIVVFLFCMQTFTGTTLRAFATYFFEQAGLPTTQAFNMAIITSSIAFMATLLTWFLIPHIGRRTLFTYALSAITIIFLIIGGLGIPHQKPALSWAVASLLVISAFVAYLGILPIVFALVAEMPSGLLRTKTVPIGRFVYTIVNAAVSVLTTYQINPTAWNWGPKTGFFYGGTSLCGLIITYFLLPETKDRTIAEIDLLFEKRVPASKFAETEVHVSEITSR